MHEPQYAAVLPQFGSPAVPHSSVYTCSTHLSHVTTQLLILTMRLHVRDVWVAKTIFIL